MMDHDGVPSDPPFQSTKCVLDHLQLQRGGEGGQPAPRKWISTCTAGERGEGGRGGHPMQVNVHAGDKRQTPVCPHFTAPLGKACNADFVTKVSLRFWAALAEAWDTDLVTSLRSFRASGPIG